MQALSRKPTAIIVSLWFIFLPAETGSADPPGFKTPIKMIAAPVKTAGQTNFSGSQRRERMPRLSMPQGVTVDKTTGKIYWTDTGTHQICRANLNGSGRQILIRWCHHPRDIAIDSVGGKMYWIDSGSHQIKRSNLNGSKQEILLNWVSNPQGIAVDAVSGKIYWTDSGTHQIHRANLNGSESETLVKWVYDPRGIAVDGIRGKIFWADFRTHQIYRANLDGSQLEVLITGFDNGINFGSRIKAAYRKMLSPFLMQLNLRLSSPRGECSMPRPLKAKKHKLLCCPLLLA